MNKAFSTIAKGFRSQVGTSFFVSDVTGAQWNALNNNYPTSTDGVKRVFTTVTLALAACTTGAGDYVVLAPDFTTALTAAELVSARSKGVTVILGAQDVGGGKYHAYRNTATLPAGTTAAIFTVNGRVRINQIIGRVMTAIQDQACTLKIVADDGTNTTDLCAATSVRNNPLLTTWNITGTFANNLVTKTSAGVVQAAPTTVEAGTLKLTTNATNTGSVKWDIVYEPLEPGAFIFAA